MSRLSIANFWADHLRIKFDFVVPDLADCEEYDLWAWALLEKKTWAVEDATREVEPDAREARLFVESFLQTFRLLCELGRLPIFDIPKVISLHQEAQIAKKYHSEIEIFVVSSVPQNAYQRVTHISLGLCRWMAKNSLTLENKNKVFKTITEKLIQPLDKEVPGGKSTIPVLRVAHSMGIPFHHLGAGVYQLGWGSKARRMDRSTSELDSFIGAKLAQNKVVTANILRLAGLPAPRHVVVGTVAEALSAAARLGYPVVVKPTDRDRGEGVSVDIVDGEALKLAFIHAHELSKSRQVIVERQVSGVCHRLFIANGSLLYGVKRLPMSVRGDGRRTIARLVDDEVSAQKAKAPWSRSEIQPIDDRALQALAMAGFTPQSIPGEGELAPLRRIESTTDGGIDEEVTTIIHPENVSVALAAAKLFGLDIAGIDIISPDICRPWYENDAIVNEVNFAPLFGGGEIARSHMRKFFEDFIDGDGKIPIETFDSEEAAIARHTEYQREGLRCYLTSAAKTIDFAGKPLIMPFVDIRQRLKALINRSDVDAITVHLPASQA